MIATKTTLFVFILQSFNTHALDREPRGQPTNDTDSSVLVSSPKATTDLVVHRSL